MARNEEKAQSMLNRWLAYKKEEEAGRVRRSRTGGQSRYITTPKRPPHTAATSSITECEKYRMEILREVGKKVMEIQNESLGEQLIRDLNDEINKLLREKGHWERRIVELGGPNYRKYERISNDPSIPQLHAGDDQKGYVYKYFGAARQLPGVKEMFLKAANEKTKRKRFDYKGIDAEYYGYGDEEDDTMVQMEKAAEEKAQEAARLQWEKDTGSVFVNTKQTTEEDTFVPIPTKSDIERALVEKKKAELLKKLT
ncbi:hypothetical protein PROFUN_14484 [Planoprotostelium fungivorum]|uniref:Pre-mRNA-splicing factor ISY1 n=1 Tax=Planoprotostelium fungivorum TaxID=1890364 RepID=A0A2P6MZY2_9EUKA|nr:hypothetical protein PROFUN_14484 [Planoprotostelium fungivorum]